MLSILQIPIVFTISILIVSTQTKEYEYPTKENSKRNGDYYSSLHGVQSLAKQEQQIVAKLVRYKEKLSDTLTLINEYLDDYSTSIHSIIKRSTQLHGKFSNDKYPILKTDEDLESLSDETSANPITVFKLLRRLAIGLEDIQYDINTNYHTKFTKYLNDVSAIFPSLDDLRGAADGLLRLQETYRMPVAEMGNGIILHKKTGCKLSAADMQFIGVRAVNVDLFATGLEWLYHAYQKVLKGDDSLPLIVIKNYLMTARHLHNDELLRFKKGPSNLFSNLVNSTYTNIPDLFIPPVVTEYPLGAGQTRRNLYDNYNFDALCRGEPLLSPKDTKNLRCWYSHDIVPFNMISPLKFEMHHENPPVLQVYDLISDKVINHIKTLSFKHLKRAKVVGSKSDAVLSDVRTSSVAWLWDKNVNDKLLNSIPRLVNRATGLVTWDSKAAEDLQVQCYGSVGGYYVPHFDSLVDPGIAKTKERQEDLKRGDRVATIMFYLSDVELGGGTAFPRMGVAARAVKGSAVIWYNLKFNGQRDPLTIHGGCPVLYGNKWVANKWIRLYEQINIRKCTKIRTE